MTKDDLIKLINDTYSPLTDPCQEELLGAIKIISVKKNSTLVKEGQFSDKIYYIVKGCARAYYLKDGKDISDWFAFENEFISSIVSFFNNLSSPHYIELIEDSILFELTKQNMEMLADKHHDFERLIRIVVTKAMLSHQERISSILFNTAKQRYENLLQIYPNVTQRMPLTHIASYLGITLETLSRNRRAIK